MTEEIVKSIVQAEAEASEAKRRAVERAAEIVAEAEARATQTERSAEEVCKAYAETQLKAARAEAEKNYQITLQTESKAAREYCADVLKKSEDCISKIVGRIVGGDC